MSAPGHLPDRVAPPWPSLPRPFVALAAVLVVVAGVAGWVGRAATVPEYVPPPAPPRVVDLGAVTVSVPASWEAAGSRVEGVPQTGRRSVAFTPLPGLSARALIVLAPFDDATLVPASLRRLAGGAPQRTTLAGLPAWTYRPRPVDSRRVARVTVVPTTAGSLAVACIAPDAAWSAAEGCAQGVGTATTRNAAPLSPSRTLAFRRRLGPVLERLGARRRELRAQLRGAATRRGQARFATRLGRAHGRALAALSPRTPAAGAPRRIATELRRTARSYQRLSVAARRGWPERYLQARVAIGRSDRALARAIARVG